MPLVTCPKCGARSIDTTAFCLKCGASLAEVGGGSFTLSCNCTHPSTMEIKGSKLEFFPKWRKKKKQKT